MQEKLIIYLHSKEPDHPSWIVLDANGIIQDIQYQGEAAVLASQTLNRIIQVIVPAADVLLTHTVLQKMNRSRLAQVLPYALEEQLIDDVDTLHFAIGDEQANGNLPVAVVSENKIKQWLHHMARWNIKPDSLTSSIFLLPWQEDTWHAIWLDDLVLVRTNKVQGFVCDPINLANMLSIALAEDKKMMPRQIILHYHGDFSKLPTFSFPHLTVLHETIEPTTFLMYAAAQLKNGFFIDLLQGKHAVKRSSFMQMSNILKTTSCLAVVWIGLIFIYPILSYLILKNRVNDIALQMRHIYQYHFPQAGSMIAPKLRMADALQKLKSQMGNQPIFIYLGLIGQGMHNTPSIQLQRLSYRQHQMTIELSAANSQDFSAFTDFLVKQGLTVTQQNANLTGSQIHASLLIE
jgi:general secretion pathway protein L